ncbi:MAG: hypothetical protein H8E37_00810, partial [Planctomycetes bacterium]|nr:hypothetical protein [Planctomycetota bacterium]
MTEPADGKATPSTSSDTSRSDAWQYTLFFGVALIAIVLLGLRPHYEGMLTYGGNTDDVRATMFVSGVGTPNGPSDELLYSNRLLGVGLKQLYQTHSGIPWYGIYLTGCHLFSHLAICFAWCRISGDWRVRIAVTAFSLGMGSYFWTSLQFTTTATLMALAGVSLVASAIAGEAGSRGGQTRSHRISHLSFAVVGWSFVVLAGFIRWHAALLTGALVLPIIVMLIVSYGRRVSTLKHLLLATIAVSTMFGMECWS